MTRNAVGFLLSLMLLLLALGSSGCAASGKKAVADVPRMPAEGLKSRLGDPSLTVIDVRANGDWKESSAKVKGAIREDANSVADWASDYSKDKTIVLYCA